MMPLSEEGQIITSPGLSKNFFLLSLSLSVPYNNLGHKAMTLLTPSLSF
jgi:hypothetical protein